EAHQEWGSGVRLLESSLELASELLGIDHPRVAELMGSLANMLLQDGRDVEEADHLCARGLDILALTYGDLPVSSDLWPRTPEDLAQIRLTFSSLYSIRAHAAFQRREPMGCRLLLNRALLMLDVPQEELSPEMRAGIAAAHGSTLQAMAHLVSEEGDDAQAERLFQRALAQAEQGDPDRLAGLLDDWAMWLE